MCRNPVPGQWQLFDYRSKYGCLLAGGFQASPAGLLRLTSSNNSDGITYDTTAGPPDTTKPVNGFTGRTRNGAVYTDAAFDTPTISLNIAGVIPVISTFRIGSSRPSA